jgi:hypothetical protein
MVNLENVFKNVKNNGDMNLGFGGKPIPTIPPGARPIDIEHLGPLLPGSPDPIDQRPIKIPPSDRPIYTKPTMPQFPYPKPDYPITPMPSPISPPFIPSPPIGPYINPINSPINNRQDLNPALQQTTNLRKKKNSSNPKRKVVQKKKCRCK